MRLSTIHPKGDQSEKPNKKRALIALSALLMLLKVHPSGFEPETFGSVVDALATNENAVGTGKTLV